MKTDDSSCISCMTKLSKGSPASFVAVSAGSKVEEAKKKKRKRLAPFPRIRSFRESHVNCGGSGGEKKKNGTDT